MSLRRVTRQFEATLLDLKEKDTTCGQLEGCDIAGDKQFPKGSPLLNDGFYKQGQVVNGVEVVQFERGGLSYCVSRAVYDASTEIAKDLLR
jgi:hypothetical protein